MIFAAILAFQTSLSVPAFTAYSVPDSEGVRINSRGANWTNPKQHLVWIGDLAKGSLEVKLNGDLSGAEFELEIDRVRRPINVTKPATFEIRTAGYRKLTLRVIKPQTEGKIGLVKDIQLSGSATAGARFNLKERRNAASVHLGYPTEKGEQVEWFYNEIRAKTDPIHTYYEACGFHRGYFGIQVNSPTERRVIFSVWDAGGVPDDRNKVKDENLVKLLAKGEGVDAGSFGNEGTGGHSHLTYNWKTPDTHRFLVRAVPDGTFTTYTGYYWFNDTKKWGLIAKFRAPKDGKYMSGLYSFNENFWGNTGDVQRHAEFGAGWVRHPDGTWRELTTARFTCDGTGQADRFDYAAGARGDRFFLSNGGAIANGVKYGDTFTRKPSKQGPPLELPE